jgi:hypothetical protein
MERKPSSNDPKMMKVLQSIKEGEKADDAAADSPTSADDSLASIAKFIINKMKDDGVSFIGSHKNSNNRQSDVSFAGTESGYSDAGGATNNFDNKDISHLVSLMSGDLIWLRNEGNETSKLMNTYLPSLLQVILLLFFCYKLSNEKQTPVVEE